MPAEFPAATQRYHDIKFCPRCGQDYGTADFNHSEYYFLCRACSFDFYQNPLPAAVVVVPHPHHVESVLVLKRRTAPSIGRWCVPGGFLRYGETPDAAAQREVREEVGAEVEIGPILRAGLVDYAYRGRQICILEIAYLARLIGAPPAADHVTNEAAELSFYPLAALLATPEILAFPEQIEVVRAFLVHLAGLRSDDKY